MAHTTTTRAEAKGKVTLWDLFNHGRIREKAPLWAKFLFVLYLPLGLLVLVTRLVMFLLVCVSVLLLPRAVGDLINIPLLRLVCGLVVRHNYKGKPLANEPYLIAGNHVSDFDTFAMWMVMPRFHTITGAHLKVIPIVGNVYSRLDAIFVAPTPESRGEVKAKIQELVKTDPNPILIFPEGGLTNGKAGTMMYHRFVFSLDIAIVPAAISMSDPWPVYHDYIGSTWAKNFFWFLFVPFHVFDITFLPSQKRNENETQEEFAVRVQKLTSSSLGIEATSFSYSDKKELAKQLAITFILNS
jgi:1-acyl-sn-glycerol-3-phosphate acyltransferase